MAVIGFVVLTVIVLMVSINIAHAQTNNGQTTLWGDLQNNPVAQDILKKIEKLEERKFEESEKQRKLEERKSIVLEHLNDDLKKWEGAWALHI